MKTFSHGLSSVVAAVPAAGDTPAATAPSANMIGRYKKTLLAFSVLCTCAAVTWLALPKPPLLEGVSFSQCVRDRNGKLLRVILTSYQQFRVWYSFPNISLSSFDAT